jgi:hypothetical protein
MAPLGAGFDLNIRGFGQALGDPAAASQQPAGFVEQVSNEHYVDDGGENCDSDDRDCTGRRWTAGAGRARLGVQVNP